LKNAAAAGIAIACRPKSRRPEAHTWNRVKIGSREDEALLLVIRTQEAPHDQDADGGQDEEDGVRVAGRHLRDLRANLEGEGSRRLREQDPLPDPDVEPVKVAERGRTLPSSPLLRTPMDDALEELAGVLDRGSPDEVPVDERGSPPPTMERRLQQHVVGRHRGG
jgi:hypothetical protein